VDGVVETRKRAKLRPGQSVEYGGQTIELRAGSS
jgi:ribosome-associated protein